MTRFFIIILLISFSLIARAQPVLKIRDIKLPAEISYYNNQVSGLYIENQKLYILSESRLQDSMPAVIYTILLSDLDKQLADSNYQLPFKKLNITGIEALRHQMDLSGNNYEGLEAMLVKGNKIYLSVETFTPAPNAYLLTGSINDNGISLDSSLVPIVKPRLNNEPVYNAGFEAMAFYKDHLLAFYEYNNFDQPSKYGGYAYQRNDNGFHKAQKISRLPFRITDISPVKKNKYAAINFFFKGGSGDTVYRVGPKDKYFRLTHNEAGYKNFLQLITLKIKRKKIVWKPLGVFPDEYNGYNMEGIAAYKNGFFVVNDKYTTKKPYTTTLVFATLP